MVYFWGICLAQGVHLLNHSSAATGSEGNGRDGEGSNYEFQKNTVGSDLLEVSGAWGLEMYIVSVRMFYRFELR